MREIMHGFVEKDEAERHRHERAYQDHTSCQGFGADCSLVAPVT